MYDQTRTIGHIATGKDIRGGGLPILFVDLHKASGRDNHVFRPTQGIQVGLLSYGQDNSITIHNPFGTRFELWVEAPIIIEDRSNFNDFQTTNTTVLTQDAARTDSRVDIKTFFQSLYNFKFGSRQFIP